MKIAILTVNSGNGRFEKFKETWKVLFEKHNCELVIVQDGTPPTVNGMNAEEVMGKYAPALTNFNTENRNLGFAYIAKILKGCEIIITLDENVSPIGDPIQDHIDALQKRVPVSWISTASEYSRGFPYSIRSEAEVVISHGVWEGSGDWDAPTQLVLGEKRPTTFYKGIIPKGIYYPMCSMNLAFKIKVLPYIFHAPGTSEIRRFDDIFAGIVSKRIIDGMGWAVVSGYATVNHKKASDPFQNLKNEAAGIELNESFWRGDENHPYFEVYRNKLRIWQEFIENVDLQEVIEPRNETETPEPSKDDVFECAEENKTENIEVPINEEKVLQQDPPTENYNELEDYQSEMNFWRGWLVGNGKANENPGGLRKRFHFMIGDKKEVKIADLGAGAMCLIGNYHHDVKVKVISSDLLADEYAKMRAELNINPQIVVEKQDMENLTYGDNTFDIVYCGNALDHTKDPYKALKEMLRICKAGGYIYLRHIAHEGKRHNYRNLHKWNIDATENGDCKFWSDTPDFQNKGFLLSDIYHGFKTTVELIPKGALITSYLQKA